MSFNYLEVARAAEIISSELPAEVLGVELVEFPLPGPLPDLNIALRLSNKRSLVFSLRNPWTGLFYTSPGAFRTSKQSWARGFDGAQDWNAYLRGQKLEKAATLDGDRVLSLFFTNGAELVIELFPGRPNWILKAGGQEFRWRPLLPPKAPIDELEEPKALIRPLKAKTAVVLREFENKSGRDWSARAYQHYLEMRQDALLTNQVQRAQTQLQARIAQVIKVRGQMMGSLTESKKADQYREKGERLKGLLYVHPKTFRASRLEDIELDPQLSLAENSNRFFDRYKKLQRTKKEVEARLGGIEEASKKLTSAIAKLRGFKRLPEENFETVYARLIAMLTEAGVTVPSDKLLPDSVKKADKKWQESGVRKFVSDEGLPVWAGRNHVENEQLVIRLARGNDMWMHLKGLPGAHVIIQLSGGKSPSLETLLDGATLVAYYSGVTSNEKVEVDYTYRKYVKRVPGNKDKFLVTYTQNKTLMVKLEETRLWRLLKQHSF